MVLDLGGQRFEGRGFDVQRSLSKRRPRYGSGPPHRKAADSYVYTAEPILHSEDGSTLRCSIAWRASEPPAGSCTTAEGRRIAVRFG